MWQLAIMLPIIFLIVSYCVWNARKQRRMHVASHSGMSGEEYLTKLGLPQTKHHLCLACRRVLADAADVPPETVYPSDSMAHLCELCGDQVDFVETLIIPDMGRQLGVGCDRRTRKSLARKLTLRKTFADFVRCYVEEWDKIVERGESCAARKSD